MSAQQHCFVCSELLDGDAAFVQHHLNACLDRQGSSTSTTSHAGSTKRRSPSPPPTLPSHFSSDAALALALAGDELSAAPSTTSTFDHDRALALALAHDDAASSSSSSDAVCPVCGASWAERGLSLPSSTADYGAARTRVLERREAHTAACLEAKGRFEEDGQRAAGAGLHGVADEDDEGDAETGVGPGLLCGRGKRPWFGGVGGRDEVRGTAGLIHVLRHTLKQSNLAPQGRTEEAWLVTTTTEHIPTRVKDWGWGCGYKNAQMIFSSLRHLSQYAKHFSSATSSSSDSSTASPSLAPIPTIREWQEIIEQAWAAGHDPDGARHFGGKLINSRRWIGTTEVYAALTWLGIRATIIDFPKLSGTSSVHEPLLKWLVTYFRLAPSSAPSTSTSPPPPSTENAFTALQSAAAAGGPVRLTAREPLYLQHRGHSRTVVGVELGSGKARRRGAVAGLGQGRGEEDEEDEAWLLVFDPGKPISHELKAAAAAAALAASTSTKVTTSSSSSSPACAANHSSPPPSKKLKLSPLLGSTSHGGFGTAGGALKYGDVLKVVRVNMRELKRKDAYQLLYIEPNEPPLSPLEKDRRKFVRSTVVTA
ncbi:uncharacterized protein RHOBADRAFT_51737 [Rhodotorula graminis WP1]|uniref:UFSP1/2/DUB catalytic domain-containing protein n=1 Tax=Rhodotorula graminis (strain WP1) TaxID=578459 RepID=A0A194S849_RHOGW|nr:uncharacterized protein RHOBADRAFT_51737 [Rhodotorula graminis WP1]KPV76739.1 hypothetical protein RHOBADRAFT_51737 [Rhodotorula graminis WP1]